MDQYPFELTLRIDWSDMDLFGHVNNVAYYKYIQASRVNVWEQSHLADDFSETRQGPILLSCACRFIKPLHYPGSVLIKSRVSFVRNTSFGISHQLLNTAGELCAEGEDVIVMFDFKTNSKIPVPEAFRSLASTAQLE